MSKILHPGVIAPDWEFAPSSGAPLVRLADFRPGNLALIFVASPVTAHVEALARFQARQDDFVAQNCQVVGISNSPPEMLAGLAAEYGLAFPLMSDAQPQGSLARLYGAVDKAGQIENTVLLLDGDGLVRRVYDAAQYPELPNPALCLRTLMKISEAPRPWPVEADDWCRGPAQAPVTLIEYADYQCRPCMENHALLCQVLPVYGERLRLVHRHLPIKTFHPLAPQAAEAAELAGAQGFFWQMHDRLFAAQGALELKQLAAYAAEIGMDQSRFSADLADGHATEKVKEAFRRAIKHKIKLTPTLFVNGLLYDGPRTVNGLQAVIDPILESLEALKGRSA
jgi:peroxiredoxin